MSCKEINKLMILENEIKNNIILYKSMKSSYSNIMGYGDIIINEFLDKTYNNITTDEITEYPYLVEDMYNIYIKWNCITK